MRTRLSKWLLLSAVFNLLVGGAVLLSALGLAFFNYTEAQVPILRWLLSPVGVIMLLLATVFLVPGLNNLLTYRSSEVAITDYRLLGQVTALIRPETFDIPLSSITKADFSPTLLGSHGDVRVSYSPRRQLGIPSVPHALDFVKRLKAALPAHLAAPEEDA